MLFSSSRRLVETNFEGENARRKSALSAILRRVSRVTVGKGIWNVPLTVSLSPYLYYFVFFVLFPILLFLSLFPFFLLLMFSLVSFSPTTWFSCFLLLAFLRIFYHLVFSFHLTLSWPINFNKFCFSFRFLAICFLPFSSTAWFSVLFSFY